MLSNDKVLGLIEKEQPITEERLKNLFSKKEALEHLRQLEANKKIIKNSSNEWIVRPREYGNFSYSSLEDIRSKLLDTSKKNKLINFKFKNALRFVNCNLEQVFNKFTKKKNITLTALKEPTPQDLQKLMPKLDSSERKITPKEWAKYLKIDPNFDLENFNENEDRSQSALQTLLYPDNFEAQLKDLKKKNRQNIQEKGVQILHLVFGFVEWFESNDSKDSKMSPLIILPVDIEEIENGKSQLIFKDDDSPLLNLTFQKKLYREFGWELPDYEPSEIALKEYFAAINKLFSEKKGLSHWNIKEYLCLTVNINFSKQAIYRDLDPKNWEKSPIEDHPIIKKLFFNQMEEGFESSSYPEEYQIDEIADFEENFPLIYDADSSQHSAIKDAIDGKNLIIEGPPGTGKSQTITNLIAACIYNDLKVLFVAEKQTALDVVKNRLDQAGIGQLCLELHSDKADKRRLIDDLNSSYAIRHSISQKNFDAEITRINNYKKKLNNYSKMVNSNWKNTGLTIAQILTKATRFKLDLKDDFRIWEIKNIDGESFNPSKAKELEDRVKTIEDIIVKVTDKSANGIAGHPWYGFIQKENTENERIALIKKLKIINEIIEEIFIECERIEKELYFNLNELSLSEVDSLLEQLKNPFKLLPSERYDLIKESLQNKGNLELIKDYQKRIDSVININSCFKFNEFLNEDLWAQVKSILRYLKKAGYSFDKNIENLSRELSDIEKIVSLLDEINNKNNSLLDEINNKNNSLKDKFPEPLQNLLNGSLLNLQEMESFVEIINSLSEDLFKMRHGGFSLQVNRSDLLELIELLPLIKTDSEKIEIYFDIEKLPAINHIKEHSQTFNKGGIFSFISADWRNSRSFFHQFSLTGKISNKKLKELIPILLRYKETELKINELIANNSFLQDIYKGIDTNVNNLLELIKWYDGIKAYEQKSKDRTVLAKQLKNLPFEDLKNIKGLWEEEIEPNYIDFSRMHNFIKEAFPNLQEINDSNIFMQIADNGYFALKNKLEDFLNILQLSFVNLDISFETAEACLIEIKKENSKINKFWEDHPDFTDIYLSSPNSFENFTIDKKNELNRVIDIVENIQKFPNEVVKKFEENCTFDYFQKWFDFLKEFQIQECHDTLKDNIEDLRNNRLIDLETWYSPEQKSYLGISNKNNKTLKHEDDLYLWQEFLRIKDKENNFSFIFEDILANKLQPKQILPIYFYSIYQQLGNEILKENQSLDTFSSLEHDALIKRFTEADKELLALQKEKIIAKASEKEIPKGNNSAKAKECTEIALIKRESSKKIRHIPIRNLLLRAQESIQTLKPCFMMSPMSLSQYLEQDKLFDILIMDEASQIKPEDAIAAIARANSTVIVGDPKQLPPTTYFQNANNSNEDEDEDEENTMEVSESILDAFIPLFTNRRLKWHYRSKHEKLIEFSNHYFYDDDLVIFPSPYHRDDALGMHYKKVDGLFIDKKNEKEAEVIIEEVTQILKSGDSKSIGIVAMNTEQSRLIEDQLEAAMNLDPFLKEGYREKMQSHEPIFVKNLENVQGDERDIIIISMTYGPKTIDAPVPQRFGPITQAGGWRRLNVLLTRAKYKMIIFSSMKSRDISVNGATNKYEAGRLKKLLQYCETKKIEREIKENNNRDPDSDFEISVAKALAKNGYECRPQLGVAGYYLDLAVINPNNDGEYLIGLECDGATYHSSKSARDRDRLRQQVLEGLGWQIERIWSTDWFKNPDGEIKRIIRTLDRLSGKINT